MSRKDLLDKLDRVTDKAARYAITQGYPISVSKKSTLVGNVFVEKNSENLYNIMSLDKHILYEDICVFDVAVIVAQRYNAGETNIVKQVLALEERFAKYHTDMIHYLHCLKGAAKRHDTERMAILEDKFQVSEILAKSTRDRITNFKRVK
jgi:hypothetical protein